MRSSITRPVPDIYDMTLHLPIKPADYGAATPSKASIEHFAPPVMHNSRKPPIMLAKHI